MVSCVQQHPPGYGGGCRPRLMSRNINTLKPAPKIQGPRRLGFQGAFDPGAKPGARGSPGLPWGSRGARQARLRLRSRVLLFRFIRSREIPLAPLVTAFLLRRRGRACHRLWPSSFQIATCFVAGAYGLAKERTQHSAPKAKALVPNLKNQLGRQERWEFRGQRSAKP